MRVRKRKEFCAEARWAERTARAYKDYNTCRKLTQRKKLQRKWLNIEKEFEYLQLHLRWTRNLTRCSVIKLILDGQKIYIFLLHSITNTRKLKLSFSEGIRIKKMIFTTRLAHRTCYTTEKQEQKFYTWFIKWPQQKKNKLKINTQCNVCFRQT